MVTRDTAWPAGTPCWVDLGVDDIAQAKAFYGGVFGWTFKPWRDGYEGIHLPDDSMIGGLRRAEGDPVVSGRAGPGPGGPGDIRGPGRTFPCRSPAPARCRPCG